MSGYIGTKAVTLSTTTANVGGDSTVGGDLTVDTNTLYVDSTNNRVGVGTSSVDSLLHISNFDATAYSPTTTDGQVGVGPTIYLENPANADNTVGGQIVFGMRSTEEQARIGATGGSSPALTFGTADAEAMRIDSSGNVGIGTSSPSEKLHIEGGANTRLKFDYTSNWEASIGIDGAAGALTFENVDGSERMRISSNGHVGIGTSSNTYPLVISTGASSAQLQLARPTDGSQRSILIFRSSSQGADVGTVSITNTGVAYNTSSDYRLKENIVTDWDATSRLKQLKPSRFNFKEHEDLTVDGFLAHEVSSIVPEAISGEKDAVDKDGNPEYQGIDQSKLVPLLTKALQEAVAKIETLEAKVTALEGN